MESHSIYNFFKCKLKNKGIFSGKIRTRDLKKIFASRSTFEIPISLKMISTVDDNRKKTLSSQIFYERTGYNNHNQHFFFFFLSRPLEPVIEEKYNVAKNCFHPEYEVRYLLTFPLFLCCFMGSVISVLTNVSLLQGIYQTDGAIYRISEPEPHSGPILGDKKGISSWAHSVWVRDFAPNENKQVSKWVRLCGFSCSRESQVDFYRGDSNHNRPLNRLFKAAALRCKQKFLQRLLFEYIRAPTLRFYQVFKKELCHLSF